MFRIDATFEDTRIIATSDDGKAYEVIAYDAHTGKTHILTDVSPYSLADILELNLSPDGEFSQAAPGKRNAALERLLLDCPPECRPIP